MNGMCIALRNGARTEAVFVEQDVLELENLNRQTAARRQRAEKQEAELIRRAAEEKKHLTREKARQRAYTLRVMRYEPQGFNKTITRPEQTLPARMSRR